MITIYHLGVSQSDRVVWLMEELGLPYHLEWYDRGADRLAPAAYRALHPAGTAPIIRDGDVVLTDSAAILEYISRKHGKAALSVGPDQPNYADYLYWMQFNNNLQATFFVKLALGGQAVGDAANSVRVTSQRREDALYAYLESWLGAHPYLAGSEFTCADIMVMFNLTVLPMFGGRAIDDLPNTQAYVARISQRPAYVKAMSIAGPAATKPG